MRDELETEQNCNILTPELFWQQQHFFPVLLGCSTGGLGAQPLLGHGSHSSIFSQLIWTSCRRGYIIIWCPPTSCERHNSHSIQPFHGQGCPLISSTGCTCYLHRCISSFNSLAGVNMLHLYFKRELTFLFLSEEVYLLMGNIGSQFYVSTKKDGNTFFLTKWIKLL